MLIDDVTKVKIREAALKIGYKNVKPKQIEAVLDIFPNFLLKVQDRALS